MNNYLVAKTGIIKQVLTGLTFILVIPFVFAEDILSIYKLAVDNDPEFQAAKSEFLALQEIKSQSVSFLLPQLNLSGYYIETDDDISGGATPGLYEYDSNGYSVTLTQALYQKDKFVSLSQADAVIAAAEATFHNAKHELILRVATQYFAFLAAKDNLAYAKAEKKAIKRQLSQSKQRFNVGLTAITDVHEAQARFDQAVASEIAARNTLAISREALTEITGKDHEHLAGLSEDYPLTRPEPDNIERWIKTAELKNAILRKAYKTVDIARFEISKSKAGHHPSLDLVAKYNFDDTGLGAINPNEREQTTVMLQLNIPLYQGGLISSRSREAAYRLQQSKDLLEKQRRAAIRQTRNSYLSVIANISQVKALKQALNSTKTALEATQAGFEVGTRTGVDVLNSQRERYRASRDYARARYDYVLQILQLKYAAGILTHNSLNNINRWLK